MWETAFAQNHNLSISGKSSNNQYYFSAGVQDQESMLKYNENSNLRYFIRGKDRYSLVENLLTIETNLAFERQTITKPTNYETLIAGLRDSWTSIPLSKPTGGYYNYGGFNPANVYGSDAGNETKLYNRAKLQFSAELTPFDNFKIRADYAINSDFYDMRWVNKTVAVEQYDGTVSRYVNQQNGAGSDYSKNILQVGNIYANYDYSIAKNNIGLTAGYSHEEVDNRYFGASRKEILSELLGVLDLGNEELQSTSESKSQSAIKSLFGRFSYDYAKKYFIEANYRRDGSSKFAEDARWGDFFGFSGAWAISQESFVKDNLSFINFMKLRASYGELGNQNNVGLFDHFALISVPGTLPFGSVDKPIRQQYAAEGGTLTSKERTWETVKINNFGLDLSVLDSRLSVNFDYFVKNTEGILVSTELPTILGISTPTINGGEFETKGYELSITWADKIEDFSYSVSVLYSDNENEIISLEDAILPGDGFNSYIEGYSAGSYFGLEYGGLITDPKELEEYKKFQGVPAGLALGGSKFIDKDGDGIIEPGRLYDPNADPNDKDASGDLVYLDNSNVRHQYSVTLSAAWKGIDFSAMFQGVGSWKVMNGHSAMGGDWWNQPYAFEYNKDWSADYPNRTWPALTTVAAVDNWNWRTSAAPYKMYDNKYIRLKNLQIGYTLPKTLLEPVKIQNLRVYFAGTDLWDSHDLPDEGFDPEKPFSYNYTPLPSIYALGIQLTL